MELFLVYWRICQQFLQAIMQQAGSQPDGENSTEERAKKIMEANTKSGV